MECNFSGIHAPDDDSFFWNPETLVILAHFWGNWYILFYHKLIYCLSFFLMS